MIKPPISVPTESRRTAHEFYEIWRKSQPYHRLASPDPLPEWKPEEAFAFAEAYAASSSLLPVGRQHNWKCVAPENAYYRWQCQNPGCSETAPYPSDKVSNSPCMGSGRQLENGPNHDVGGAFLQELRPEPESPSCHVCGSLTIPTEWKCVCCGTTTKPTASLPVGESRWAILFDDPEVDREVFVGNGAEEAAKKRYVQCLNNWTCYLFKEVGLGESQPRTHDCSKNLIASEERGSLGNGDWPAHCGQCGRSFRNRDELNRFAGRGETTSAE